MIKYEPYQHYWGCMSWKEENDERMMNHINIIEARCYEEKEKMKEWWKLLLKENIKVQYQLGFKFIKFRVYKSFYIIKTLQN